MGRFLICCTFALEGIAVGLAWLSSSVVLSSLGWLLLAGYDGLADVIASHLPGLTFLPDIVFPPVPVLFQWDAWHIAWGMPWLGAYLCARIWYAWKSLRGSRRAPANTVHDGGPRWTVLDACTKDYQRQVACFSPVPLRLSMPETWRYTERPRDSVILWQWHVPLIPPGLLSANRQALLRPLLARELAKQSSADLTLHTMMETYPDPWPDGLLGWVLLWLRLPAFLKHTIWWKRWYFRRELAYDTFALFCGQGEALVSILETQKALGFQTMASVSRPSTEERIEHLMGLLRREYEQMEADGLDAPKTFPEPLPEDLADFLVPHKVIRRRLVPRERE